MKSLNDFCHCVHLLCRILTFKSMCFINCCITWSCSCWLKQVMVTWVQPRHQGSLSILCIFVHISYMLRVTLFTFGKYLPIQFSYMIKIRFFAFVKCPPLRFSCFSIFSNLFLAELCLLISELIVSSPSCHVFLHVSFPCLFFGWHICHCFIIVCSFTLIYR